LNAVEYLQLLSERYKGRGWITLQLHEREYLSRIYAVIGERWDISTMWALMNGTPVEANAFVTAMNMNIESARRQLARSVARRLRS
jgi:proline dehydrogenase